MLYALIFTLMCHHGLFVTGVRFDEIAVPPDRHQMIAPHTMATLSSRASLGGNNSFRASSGDDVITAKGVKLRRLLQTFGGYEVYGSSVTAELTFGGRYTGHLTGEVVRDLSDDIPDPEVCQRHLDEVLAVAIQAEGFTLNDRRIQDKDSRRIVYVRPDNGKGVMAYMVNFFVDDVISKPLYIIDACEDTIYTTYNLIHNATTHRQRLGKRVSSSACTGCNPSIPGYGGNPKTGRKMYNVSPRCLKMTQSGSTCKMEGPYGKVVNNIGSTTRYKNTVISFTCSQGYTDPYTKVNGAYGVANDAMYFGHITGDFYVKKYSFKALSWVPKLVVHYGTYFENAFWTGTDMYFGDGKNRYYPLVCLDVTAHELAHGITSTNSGLEYQYQSGGINEAFSDISGEVVEYYSTGSNDWLIGADIMKYDTALRYFEDPTDDGKSVKHVQDYNNDMNVHYSSGIYNHAFYRMVTKYNMPIYDAYRCFLDANRSRWGRNTGFSSGACHVARACYAAGISTTSVSRAFSSVGISLNSCSLSLHGATIFSGQTQSNILVSATTNPILEINLDKGNFTIAVLPEDYDSDITLTLATDERAEDVVEENLNSLVVDSGNDNNIVFVKLKSSTITDIQVELKVI